MENSNKEFLDSLDLIDEEMEKFIPYSLQDLSELGSIPEYIYRLVERNTDSLSIKKIIDFGCGKGAVLLYLAERLNFQGTGIDIVPEFIEAADKVSAEKLFDNRLEFHTGNILEYIDKEDKYDLVLYGYDSEILGNVSETISRLIKCIDANGYCIMEIACTPEGKPRLEGLPTEKELLWQMRESPLQVVDKIYWDIDKIKSINNYNNECINNRISELKEQFPGSIDLFDRYMANQIEECKLIENDMICSTWILRKNETTNTG